MVYLARKSFLHLFIINIIPVVGHSKCRVKFCHFLKEVYSKSRLLDRHLAIQVGQKICTVRRAKYCVWESLAKWCRLERVSSLKPDHFCRTEEEWLYRRFGVIEIYYISKGLWVLVLFA